MDVQDFKMVYYNPWDAQYLAYLVVDCDEENYAEELSRLAKCPQEEYKGYYSVEGFGKEYGKDYELLAMNSDAYHALQDTGGRIMTGPTGTNVNDVAVALIEK